MDVKNIWTEDDFDEMEWHDSYIHSMNFHYEQPQFVLEIDYIFSWMLNEESGLYNFWISPCSLIFQNILNLKINLDFENRLGIYIVDVKKENPRYINDNKIEMWDYSISTDNGTITFESTGFIQKVNKKPIFSNSQVLQR